MWFGSAAGPQSPEEGSHQAVAGQEGGHKPCPTQDISPGQRQQASRVTHPPLSTWVASNSYALSLPGEQVAPARTHN